MNDLCKVLIVDDEYIMRQGFKHMIDWEPEGYELVGEASDGLDGLKKIEELRPHIVFTDIVMSKMDGVEFVQIIQKKYPEICIVVLSSYDNFEYVKSTLLSGAIDYILKPTLNPDELRRVLRKATMTLPLFCKKETGNTAKTGTDIATFLATPLDTEEPKQGFPYENGCFFGVWYSLQEDRSVLEEICLKELQMKEGVEIIPLFSEKRIQYFVSYESEKKQQMMEHFQKAAENLRLYREEIYCVAGHEFKDYTSMKKEYFSSLETAFADHFYHHSENFLDLNQGEIVVGKRVAFDFYEYSRLLNSGNYFEAAALLRDYVGSAVENFVDEEWLKNLTSNMFFNMVTSMAYDTGKFEEMRRRMMSAYYVEDFRTEFEVIMEELLVFWNDTNKPENSKIRPILEYIDKHYDEELSLNDLAEYFGFNYNYLSSYFSSIMKEGYSSYLNQVRIKKACLFLEQGELPISEVGVRTGYLEHSYFCRVFKKKVGCTPREYRKKYLGKGNHENKEAL